MTAAHRRDQQQRIDQRHLHCAAQSRVSSAAIDVLHAENIGQKQPVEQPALQQPRHVHPMVKLGIIDAAIARMCPQPLLDVTRRRHVERVQQDARLSHGHDGTGQRMIRDRLWLSPLWVQGLVQVATFVVFIGAMVVVLYPMFIARVGWPLSVLAVVALCAIVSGATLYLQRPVRQRGLDALGGGTQADRLAALAALRTGEVPADADVLAAAIRYGAVVRAYQADTSRTQRAIQWLGPVVAILYGVFGLFRLPLRFGAVLIAVGIWWAVLSVLRERRRRRTFQNLGALRAATGPEPSSTGEDDAVAGLPPSRHRLAAAVALIAVAAFMTLVYFVVRSDPDCYYVADAANLIYDQRQLTDPQNMTSPLTPTGSLIPVMIVLVAGTQCRD